MATLIDLQTTSNSFCQPNASLSLLSVYGQPGGAIETRLAAGESLQVRFLSVGLSDLGFRVRDSLLQSSADLSDYEVPFLRIRE
jgi:hypothetical protein